MYILCIGTNTSSNHGRSVVPHYKIDVNKCKMLVLHCVAIKKMQKSETVTEIVVDAMINYAFAKK